MINFFTVDLCRCTKNVNAGRRSHVACFSNLCTSIIATVYCVLPCFSAAFGIMQFKNEAHVKLQHVWFYATRITPDSTKGFDTSEHLSAVTVHSRQTETHQEGQQPEVGCKRTKACRWESFFRNTWVAPICSLNFRCTWCLQQKLKLYFVDELDDKICSF